LCRNNRSISPYPPWCVTTQYGGADRAHSPTRGKPREPQARRDELIRPGDAIRPAQPTSGGCANERHSRDSIGATRRLARIDGRNVISDKLIKVVIAEDHPLSRQGLVDLLGTTDDIVVVGQASDGAGAIELAQGPEGEPDVIFVDVRMPGIDGLEVTRRISEEHPAVNVIILTAMDDPETVGEAMRAGAKAYVLKTADGDEVIETVRMVARGHVVIDAKTWGALTSGAPGPSPHDTLSRREIQVMPLLAQGHTNKQIGEALGISAETVKSHVDRICKRLDATDRTDAVAKAIRAGVIE
jgi:DNA-binding NarL/FixJ family response regulator